MGMEGTEVKPSLGCSAGAEVSGEVMQMKPRSLSRPRLSDVQGAFAELDMNSSRAERPTS